MFGIVGRSTRRKLLYERYEGGFFGDLTANAITYRVEPPGIVEANVEPDGFVMLRFLAPGTANLFASVDYGEGVVKEAGPITVTVEALAAPAPAKLGPVLLDNE